MSHLTGLTAIAICAGVAGISGACLAQTAHSSAYDGASDADRSCRMEVANSNSPNPRQVYNQCMARLTQAAGSSASAGPSNTPSGGEVDTILQRADQAADTARHTDDQYGNAEHQAVALYVQAGKMGDRRGAVGLCQMERLNDARLAARYHTTATVNRGSIDTCANMYMTTWQSQRLAQHAASTAPAHAKPVGLFKVACVSVEWAGVDWKGKNVPPSLADVFTVTVDPARKSIELSTDPFHGDNGSAGVVTSLIGAIAAQASVNPHAVRTPKKLFQDGLEGTFASLGPSNNGAEGFHDTVSFGAGGINFTQQNYNLGRPTIASGGVYRYADQTLELSGELYHSNNQCAYSAADALREAVERLDAGS